MSAWTDNWEGRIIELQGESVKIEKQLSEYLDPGLAQRQILALASAKIKNNLHTFMVKIRYEYVPLNTTLYITALY